MGFWGNLGKIASIAGPLAAAPFTGGTSLLGMMGMGAKTAATIGGLTGMAGNLARGASAQRAQDRGAQMDYNIYNDQNRLNYAKYNQDAQTQGLRRGVSADLLGSMQKPTDPRAQPYLNSGSISPQVLERLRTTQAPQMQVSAQPKPSGMDSFLNTLGMAGTAMDALGASGLMKPKMIEPPTAGLEGWMGNQRGVYDTAPANPLAAGSFADWLAAQQGQTDLLPMIQKRTAQFPPLSGVRF